MRALRETSEAHKRTCATCMHRIRQICRPYNSVHLEHWSRTFRREQRLSKFKIHFMQYIVKHLITEIHTDAQVPVTIPRTKRYTQTYVQFILYIYILLSKAYLYICYSIKPKYGWTDISIFA